MAFDSKVSFCPECFKEWYLFKPTDTPEKIQNIKIVNIVVRNCFIQK